MELFCSYVVLSFMLLCILLIYLFMVCRLIFVVSNMIRMSSTYLALYAIFLVSIKYLFFCPHIFEGISLLLGWKLGIP